MSEDRFSPPRRSKRLSIAIPASIVDDIPHKRDKTLMVGLIGRAASIFRVNEIIVYRDMPNTDQKESSELIADILSYMETPQYLRRRLIPMKPSLRYAGVLPPLRTPHHPVKRRFVDLFVGEYREGIVISSSEKRSLVDIGVSRPAHIPNVKLPIGKRVTVKIVGLGRRALGKLVSKEDVEIYWGYTVRNRGEKLSDLLRREADELIIATSRRGKDVHEEIDQLKERIKLSKKILLLFGAPTQGLYEIAKRENLNLEESVDFVLNMIRNQGTATVRTEEAVVATLAIINMVWEKG